MRAHVLELEVIAAEDGRRNDDVGVDGPEREFEAACEDFAPALRFTTGVFVADEHCGADFFEEFLDRIIGVAAENKADTALGCVRFDVAQTLLHEVVVTQVGVGVVRDDRKEDHDGQTEQVGDVNRNIKSGVVLDAHGALHPVDDAFAVGARRLVASDNDARVFCELLKSLRGSGCFLHFGRRFDLVFIVRRPGYQEFQ